MPANVFITNTIQMIDKAEPNALIVRYSAMLIERVCCRNKSETSVGSFGHLCLNLFNLLVKELISYCMIFVVVVDVCSYQKR